MLEWITRIIEQLISLFNRQTIGPIYETPIAQLETSEIIMKDVTIAQWKQIVPRFTHADKYIPHLNNAMRDAEINTPLRQAAFIAQIAHESGGFWYLTELGNDAYFKKYEGRKGLRSNPSRKDSQRTVSRISE